MGVIYKATNMINGKSYIGFTVHFKRRQQEHKMKGRRDGPDRRYFHKALAKHGCDNFKWEILKENAELNDEIQYIEEEKTFWEDGGYNLTRGGEGTVGRVVSEETKIRMSAAQKGKKHSENHKNNIGAALKGKKCKPFSDSTKMKMSESHKGKKHSEETKNSIGAALKGNSNCLGMIHTEETRRKMSEARKRYFQKIAQNG